MSTITFIAPLSAASYYAAAKHIYLKIWLEEDLTFLETTLERKRRKVSIKVPATESNRSSIARHLNTQEKVQITLDTTTRTEVQDKYQGTISLYQGDNVRCVPSMPISLPMTTN